MEHWPVDRLNQFLAVMMNENSLPDELVHFCQGIEAVCNPLFNPTPFYHPLDPKPNPASTCHSISNENMNNNLIVHIPTDNNIVPALASFAPPAPSTLSADRGRNYASFDKFMNASRATQEEPQVADIPSSGEDRNFASFAEFVNASRAAQEQQQVANAPSSGGDRNYANFAEFVDASGLLKTSKSPSPAWPTPPHQAHLRTQSSNLWRTTPLISTGKSTNSPNKA